MQNGAKKRNPLPADSEQRARRRIAGQIDGPEAGRFAVLDTKSRLAFQMGVLANITQQQEVLDIDDFVLWMIKDKIDRDVWDGCLLPVLAAHRRIFHLEPLSVVDWYRVIDTLRNAVGMRHATRNKGLPTDVMQQGHFFPEPPVAEEPRRVKLVCHTHESACVFEASTAWKEYRYEIAERAKSLFTALDSGTEASDSDGVEDED